MLAQQYYQEPHITSMTQENRYQTINNTLPGVFTGLIGAIQLLFWIAIVILEIVSVYYDAGRGTIYAGFWCSIIFFLTWTSMFYYLCCGNKSGFESYLVVLNGISALFSIALIVFTSLFIDNPCLCFGVLCRIPNWEYDNKINFIIDHRYSCTERTWKKLPILKVLLACAIVIFVSNIVFILIYLVVSIRLRIRKSSLRRTPEINYPQQSSFVDWSRLSSYYPSNIDYLSYQHPSSYPIHPIQRSTQWESALSSHRIYSENF